MKKKGKVREVRKNKDTRTALNILQKHFMEQGVRVDWDLWHQGALKVLEKIGRKIGSKALNSTA